MAQVAARLVFWKPVPGGDDVEAGKQLCAGSVPSALELLDSSGLLANLKAKRGFTRLGVRDRLFFLDNVRAEASMKGDIHERHLDVRFYGNFEKLAEPLFQFMSGQGLLCYVECDPDLLRAWPTFTEPQIDSGYAARMQRALDRHNQKLREQESDPKQRAKLMSAYMRSEEFQREMACEHDAEKSAGAGLALSTRDREAPVKVDLILTAAGNKRIQVITVVRQLTGRELKEAKELVDEPPSVILEGVDRERADLARMELEAQGARVDLRPTYDAVRLRRPMRQKPG